MMMKKEQINYIAFLSNVNSSIMGVKFDHGFKVNSLLDQQCFDFFKTEEKLPIHEIFNRISTYQILNHDEKKAYYIGNSFEAVLNKDAEGRLQDIPDEFAKFHGDLVVKYLNEKIRLMRLFKEGNISLSFQYYFVGNTNRHSLSRFGTSIPIMTGKYSLASSEIQLLSDYLEQEYLPFKKDYLQLAFESFERSYDIVDLNLAFLSLIICLEVLFNPGNNEIGYQIARGVAALLGVDRNNFKNIFKEVKTLYSKRSKIVHRGEGGIIKKDDVQKLRKYVRESIKAISKLDKEKKALLEELNSVGYNSIERSDGGSCS